MHLLYGHTASAAMLAMPKHMFVRNDAAAQAPRYTAPSVAPASLTASSGDLRGPLGPQRAAQSSKKHRRQSDMNGKSRSCRNRQQVRCAALQSAMPQRCACDCVTILVRFCACCLRKLSCREVTARTSFTIILCHDGVDVLLQDIPPHYCSPRGVQAQAAVELCPRIIPSRSAHRHHNFES